MLSSYFYLFFFVFQLPYCDFSCVGNFLDVVFGIFDFVLFMVNHFLHVLEVAAEIVGLGAIHLVEITNLDDDFQLFTQFKLIFVVLLNLSFLILQFFNCCGDN